MSHEDYIALYTVIVLLGYAGYMIYLYKSNRD